MPEHVCWTMHQKTYRQTRLPPKQSKQVHCLKYRSPPSLNQPILRCLKKHHKLRTSTEEPINPVLLPATKQHFPPILAVHVPLLLKNPVTRDGSQGDTRQDGLRATPFLLQRNTPPTTHFGIDIAKGNCSAGIPPGTDFGIVQVSGNFPFQDNECLQKEVDNLRQKVGNRISLYAVAAFEGQKIVKHEHPKRLARIERCQANLGRSLAFCYGYLAGQHAAEYADDQEVYEEDWWIDVEPIHDVSAPGWSGWSGDKHANRQSVTGEIRGIQATAAQRGLAAPRFGVYSNLNLYRAVVGDWKNGLPCWVATPGPDEAAARTYFKGNNFTGGPTFIVQQVGRYRHGVELDTDYVREPQ